HFDWVGPGTSWRDRCRKIVGLAEQDQECLGWKTVAVLSGTISCALMTYAALESFPFTGVGGVVQTIFVPPLPDQGVFFWFPLLASVPLGAAVALQRSWIVALVLGLACVMGLFPNAKYLMYGADGLQDYMAGMFVST